MFGGFHDPLTLHSNDSSSFFDISPLHSCLGVYFFTGLLELFRLDNQDNETVCMLLILDYRRPSVLDDFPILKEIEDEDSFEGAENYIHTVIISEKKLEENIVDQIAEVIEV